MKEFNSFLQPPFKYAHHASAIFAGSSVVSFARRFAVSDEFCVETKLTAAPAQL
jgi:hypothetical protein